MIKYVLFLVLLLYSVVLADSQDFVPKNMLARNWPDNDTGISTDGYTGFYHGFRSKPAVAGWIFYPKGYNPSTQTTYPLLVFMGGSLEVADIGQGTSYPPFAPYSIPRAYYRDSYYDNNSSTRAIVVIIAYVCKEGWIVLPKNKGYQGSSSGYTDALFEAGVADMVSKMISRTEIFYETDNLTTTKALPVTKINPDKVFFSGFSYGASVPIVLLSNRNIFNGYLMIDYMLGADDFLYGFAATDARKDYIRDIYSRLRHCNFYLLAANPFGQHEHFNENAIAWYSYMQSIADQDSGSIRYWACQDSPYIGHGQAWMCAIGGGTANQDKYLIDPSATATDRGWPIYCTNPNDNLSGAAPYNANASRSNGYMTPLEWLLSQDKKSAPEDPHPYGDYEYRFGSMRVLPDNTTSVLGTAGNSVLYYKWLVSDNKSLTVQGPNSTYEVSYNSVTDTLSVNGQDLTESNNWKYVDNNTAGNAYTIGLVDQGSQIFSVESSYLASLNIYFDPAGDDNNSGSTSSTTAGWTGTVDCSDNSTTITRHGGAAWDNTTCPIGGLIHIPVTTGSYNQILRIIGRPDSSTIMVAPPARACSVSTAKIGGALKSLQTLFCETDLVSLGSPDYAAIQTISGFNITSRSILPLDNTSAADDINCYVKGSGTYSSPDYSLFKPMSYVLTRASPKRIIRILGYKDTVGDGGFDSSGNFKGPCIELGVDNNDWIEWPNLFIDNSLYIKGVYFYNSANISSDASSPCPISLSQSPDGQGYALTFDNCKFYQDNIDGYQSGIVGGCYGASSNTFYPTNANFFDCTIRSDSPSASFNFYPGGRFVHCVFSGVAKVAGNCLTYGCKFTDNSTQTYGMAIDSYMNVNDVSSVGPQFSVNCAYSGNVYAFSNGMFYNSVTTGSSVISGVGVYTATPVGYGVLLNASAYSYSTPVADYSNIMNYLPDGTKIYDSVGDKKWRNPIEYLKKRVPNNRTLPKSAFGIQ